MGRKKITKSFINELKENNRISDKVLVSIGTFSLEELIAIKLELCANDINNRLYGFDIWRKTSYIVKDAVLKFSISTTKSKKDAARFLGITPTEFYKACKQFNITESFNE
tara:strand:- start:356 stop:685 length:330 start_codon:yes stop_codon:yes gene_type:complete